MKILFIKMRFSPNVVLYTSVSRVIMFLMWMVLLLPSSTSLSRFKFSLLYTIGRAIFGFDLFCLLSQHEPVPFQKRCHTPFPTEYFLDLICRLGTRMSTIFQTFSWKPIANLVEHLWWSFFARIGRSLKLLSILAKKLHCRCSARF